MLPFIQDRLGPLAALGMSGRIGARHLLFSMVHQLHLLLLMVHQLHFQLVRLERLFARCSRHHIGYAEHFRQMLPERHAAHRLAFGTS